MISQARKPREPDAYCEIRALAQSVRLTLSNETGTVQLVITPSEARRLAKVLRRQAETAQRNSKQLQRMEDILK